MNDQWQSAFGLMTNGLYVLTTCYGEEINGMIASWATQVSHEPPLILVAVHPNRYSHDLMERSQSFALHIIRENQQEMIDRMMVPEPAVKFTGLDWRPGQTQCPILADCLAWFECELTAQHHPGNHTLFIGQVVDAGLNATGRPLCTFDCKGRYVGRT